MAYKIVPYDGPIVTRDSARTQGLTHYFTGVQCARGHMSLRYTSTGSCRVCARIDSINLRRIRREDPEKLRIDIQLRRESYIKNADKRRAYSIAYQAAHPPSQAKRELDAERRKIRRLKNLDHEKQIQREWRIKNPERKKSNDLSWYLANREKVYAYIAKWRKSNTEKINAFTRNYRSKKKNVDGIHNASDVQSIFERQNGICACGCGASISGKYEVDHIFPISRGGSNWPENLQLLTVKCNRSKQDKTMDEWAAWKAEIAITSPKR